VCARRRAQRFGWATVGCDILQVYRDVLPAAHMAALAV
jgi:hypothetical protein